MPLSQEELAAIRCRLAAISKGPWDLEDICPDSTFIAHARTDVPLLVDEVERLQADADFVRDDSRCGFCGRGSGECKTLVSGPVCCICDDCVTLALGAIADGVLRKKWQADSIALRKAEDEIAALKSAALEKLANE